jgi:hypothetical protein
MPDALATLQQRMLGTIADLMAARDYLGPDEWQRQFEQAIIEHHAAAYFAGQGTNALTPAGDAELGRLLQTQLDYLAGFAEAVDALTPAQAAARAALSAGPLRATYARGSTTLWDLPFYPGEGTPCMGNCHCTWRVVVEDEEELNARAWWVLGSGEHCAGCRGRAAANPYTFRAGVLQ